MSLLTKYVPDKTGLIPSSEPTGTDFAELHSSMPL